MQSKLSISNVGIGVVVVDSLNLRTIGDYATCCATVAMVATGCATVALVATGCATVAMVAKIYLHV